MASKSIKADEADLVKQRGIIKRKLTLFKKHIHFIQNNWSLTDIQVIELKKELTEFKSIHKTFLEIQTLIELNMNISEFTDEPDPECEQFENDYQLMVAQASQLIQLNDKPVTNSEPNKEHSGGIQYLPFTYHTSQATIMIGSSTGKYFMCLSQLSDTIHKNLRALDTLGEETEYWDTLIIYLVSSKLDSNTLRYWEEYKNTLTDMPTLDCLKKFLKNRAYLLETLEDAKINNNISKTESQVGRNTKSFTKHHTPKEPTCSICKQHHLLFSCERFRQMSIEQRIKEVEKSKVCSNCLHPGHDYKSCRGGACNTNTLCLIINQISNSVPHTYIHRNTIQIPSCIQLADPDFNIPAPINLLLGADIFWQVMGTGKIPLGKQQPVLQETELGWLISGCISDIQTQNTNQNSSFFVNQISDNMNRFWELENISTPSDISQIAQQTCEEIFTSTTTRKDDGRFVECLGQSYNQAKNRFLNIEKRFKSDPTYQQEYLTFMQEYLGHMTKNTYRNTKTPSYYIPHHGIIQVIMRDFYCDDLLTGSDKKSRLIDIALSVNTALKSAQFPLRK
ncbi:hypothetical protein HW555_011919 [Spodoptera exigua]|uniref:Peptidase aspartic putative domain-containing protein n=1 Tax=Spodoptera exigua TaxID=7107 RepID=A0A835KZJ2_SPOEX|nr:hypothetical protein HW555_011919 [Spodoptera exigua]